MGGLFRPSLSLGPLLLAIVAGTPPVIAQNRAQDRASVEIVPNVPLSDAAGSVVFSPDGAPILLGTHGKTLKLWDAASGQLIRTFEHSDFVSSAAFSPDGKRLLSGSQDMTLKLWDAASGQLVRTF